MAALPSGSVREAAEGSEAWVDRQLRAGADDDLERRLARFPGLRVDPVDLARELDEKEVAVVRSIGRTRIFAAGEQIIETGESSRSFYVLNTGVAHVARKLPNRDDALLIAYLYPGNIFGEIAFLTGEPRTATIVAETDCIVQEFSLEDLGDERKDLPLINATLMKLAARRKLKNTRQELKGGAS